MEHFQQQAPPEPQFVEMTIEQYLKLPLLPRNLPTTSRASRGVDCEELSKNYTPQQPIQPAAVPRAQRPPRARPHPNTVDRSLPWSRLSKCEKTNEKIKLMIRLLHSNTCPMDHPEVCTKADCVKHRAMINHFMACTKKPCELVHCREVFVLTKHFSACRTPNCEICLPLTVITNGELDYVAAHNQNLSLNVEIECRET